VKVDLPGHPRVVLAGLFVSIRQIRRKILLGVKTGVKCLL